MDEFKSPEAGGGQPAQATKLDLEVKVYPTQKESNILATASITLGGCFTVKGVKIVDGKNGLSWVSTSGRWSALPSVGNRQCSGLRC